MACETRGHRVLDDFLRSAKSWKLGQGSEGLLDFGMYLSGLPVHAGPMACVFLAVDDRRLPG